MRDNQSSRERLLQPNSPEFGSSTASEIRILANSATRDALSLIFPVAWPVGEAAFFEIHLIVVGADTLRRLQAPEIGHPGLIIGIAGEILAVDDHRFAVKVFAALGRHLGYFGHEGSPNPSRLRLSDVR